MVTLATPVTQLTAFEAAFHPLTKAVGLGFFF